MPCPRTFAGIADRMETGPARKGNRVSLRMTSGLARKHGLPVCMTVNPSPESVHFTLPLTPAGRGHSAAMQGNLKVQAPMREPDMTKRPVILAPIMVTTGLTNPETLGKSPREKGSALNKKPPRQAGRRTISFSL